MKVLFVYIEIIENCIKAEKSHPGKVNFTDFCLQTEKYCGYLNTNLS